jgi:hypothetical protein
MGEPPFTSTETFDSLSADVVPERLPLLLTRPDIMALVYGNAEALPVLQEPPDFDGAGLHGDTSTTLVGS